MKGRWRGGRGWKGALADARQRRSGGAAAKSARLNPGSALTQLDGEYPGEGPRRTSEEDTSAFRWDVLDMSMKFGSLNASFKPEVSLLVFCLPLPQPRPKLFLRFSGNQDLRLNF